MSVSVALATADSAGEAVEVSQRVFGGAFNEALVHQAVVAYLAGARQGSKAQKSRADARGGGRKPWRQKRTGRARAGSIRSPLWRGGGRTFAARPRDHSVKLNRKMYRGAMRCILAELVRQNRLLAIPPLALDAPKTKALAAKLDALELPAAKVLLVAAEVDRNLDLAARNLRGVDVCDVEALSPVALVGHDTVLVEVEALRRIEANLEDAPTAAHDAAPSAEDANETEGESETEGAVQDEDAAEAAAAVADEDAVEADTGAGEDAATDESEASSETTAQSATEDAVATEDAAKTQDAGE